MWKVNENVISIFNVAEAYFKSATKNLIWKIDSEEIVSKLLKEPVVLQNFSRIRLSSSDEIKKEIAMNLLEDLLTLYVRVRTFSAVRDKQQAFKIQKSKTRARSLRTSLKKQASCLEQRY